MYAWDFNIMNANIDFNTINCAAWMDNCSQADSTCPDYKGQQVKPKIRENYMKSFIGWNKADNKNWE